MAIKTNIRDFLPAGTPWGAEWWKLPKEERDALLAEANVKCNAFIANRKAEIAEEKAAKDRLARTCQICGRRIFAEVGVIAHHGYERPGDGYQTQSCRGARQLPYEADRAVLGTEIDFLRDMLVSNKEVLRKMVAEETTYGIEWVDQAERRKNPSNAFAGYRYMKGITRDNWDTMKADTVNAEAFRQSYFYTFDQLKERTCENQEDKVERIQTNLTHQEERYDAWIEKETWDVSRWVSVL